MVKNLPANAGDTRDVGLIPGLGRSPWSRKWPPTPVFLPGKFHGKRSFMGTVHGAAKSQTGLSAHPHTDLCVCVVGGIKEDCEP